MIKFVRIVGVVVCVLAAATVWAEDVLIDRIVAVVEDEAIFNSDVEMMIAQLMFQQGRTSMTDAERTEMYNRILKEMIDDKLVISQAGRLEIDVPFSVVEERVDQTIEQNKNSLGGHDAFEQQLEREGLTLESLKQLYRQQIRNRMLVDEVLRMEVSREQLEISESELQKFYEEKKSEFPQRPSVVHLKAIFVGFESSDQVRVDAEARSKDIYDRIMAGESFVELAKQLSEDPSAPAGGDLGFVEPKDLADQAFSEAVAGLDVGETSAPVLTKYGYHIIQVTAKRETTGEVRIRHILTRFLAGDDDVEGIFADIAAVRQDIEDGASFEEMADKYNTDTEVSEGGDLGWLKTEDLPEFFQEVLAGMQPGDISQVLREPSGFRIVKLVDRQEPRPYEYAEIREELQRLYRQEKLETVYTEYVKGLRDKFFVVVYQ